MTTVFRAAFAIVLFSALFLPAQAQDQRADYPVPPETAVSLFYLQRSTNSNTVIYDANLTADGKLDDDEPVIVYWRRYNSGGNIRGPKFIEKLYAYGITTDDAQADSATFHFTAYDKIRIKVSFDDAGKPRAIIELEGRPALLKSIYLDVDDSGFIPSIKTVHLFGEDIETGVEVEGEIKP